MRILIIDDSPADRELSIRLLEREFTDAEFVEIGRKPEFLAAIAGPQFDAALTDFRLHWADGFYVLKELKKHHPHVPVVFMTESGSEEIAVEAMKAGLNDYVLKQHPHRLPIAMRESIEKAKLRRQYNEALAELEAIFASLPDAVYVGNESGITRCNPVALENLGCCDLEDLHDKIGNLGAKLDNRYADTGTRIAPQDEAFARALGGQPWTYEVISRNLKTGKDIIQRCAARPIIRDGRTIGAVAVNTDITEQKRAEQILRKQQRRLEILHQLDQTILLAERPETIAAAAMRPLVETTSAVGALAFLFSGNATVARYLAGHGPGLESPPPALPLVGDWPLAATLRGETTVIEDVAALPDTNPMKQNLMVHGVRCYVVQPLRFNQETTGAIVVGYREPGAPASDVLDFVGQVAAQVAVGIQQARLIDQLQTSQQQLRTLTHRLVALQEDERRNLSRELHDRSGQSMTMLKLGLTSLRRKADDPEAVRVRVDELLGIADEVMSELHDLAVSLRPSALDRYGLVPALEQYLFAFRNQHHIEVELAATGLDGDNLPDEIATVVYRIVQESLTNVARHAHAGRVRIAICRRDDAICCLVQDDGRGFDVDEALQRGRLGLLGMRERAEMLGGRLSLTSSAAEGTCIQLDIPLRAAQRDQ